MNRIHDVSNVFGQEVGQRRERMFLRLPNAVPIGDENDVLLGERMWQPCHDAFAPTADKFFQLREDRFRRLLSVEELEMLEKDGVLVRHRPFRAIPCLEGA